MSLRGCCPSRSPRPAASSTEGLLVTIVQDSLRSQGTPSPSPDPPGARGSVSTSPCPRGSCTNVQLVGLYTQRGDGTPGALQIGDGPEGSSGWGGGDPRRSWSRAARGHRQRGPGGTLRFHQEGALQGWPDGGDMVTTEVEAVRLDGMSEKLPVKETKEWPACGWGEWRRRVRFARSDNDGGSLGPW